MFMGAILSSIALSRDNEGWAPAIASLDSMLFWQKNIREKNENEKDEAMGQQYVHGLQGYSNRVATNTEHHHHG